MEERCLMNQCQTWWRNSIHEFWNGCNTWNGVFLEVYMTMRWSNLTSIYKVTNAGIFNLVLEWWGRCFEGNKLWMDSNILVTGEINLNQCTVGGSLTISWFLEFYLLYQDGCGLNCSLGNNHKLTWFQIWSRFKCVWLKRIIWNASCTQTKSLSSCTKATLLSWCSVVIYQGPCAETKRVFGYFSSTF